MMPTPTRRLGDSRGAQAKRYTNPERSNDLDDAVAWLRAPLTDSAHSDGGTEATGLDHGPDGGGS